MFLILKEMTFSLHYFQNQIMRMICVCDVWVYAGRILIACARGCFYCTKINLQLIKLIEIKPVETESAMRSFELQKSANFL